MYIICIIYIFFLFFPLSKGQRRVHGIPIWRELTHARTHIRTHTNTYTHTPQMARSSLGATVAVIPLHTPERVYSPLPRATGLNAKRASLTNLFFIPPLSSFIAGLWTFTRRPPPPPRPPPLSSKRVWNGEKKKKYQKDRLTNIAVFWYPVCLFPRSKSVSEINRKRETERWGRGK